MNGNMKEFLENIHELFLYHNILQKHESFTISLYVLLIFISILYGIIHFLVYTNCDDRFNNDKVKIHKIHKIINVAYLILLIIFVALIITSNVKTNDKKILLNTELDNFESYLTNISVVNIKKLYQLEEAYDLEKVLKHRGRIKSVKYLHEIIASNEIQVSQRYIKRMMMDIENQISFTHKVPMEIYTPKSKY